jgi:transcription elongation factor Elf1
MPTTTRYNCPKCLAEVVKPQPDGGYFIRTRYLLVKSRSAPVLHCRDCGTAFTFDGAAVKRVAAA